MKATQNRPHASRQGSTLVLVLIFIGMFSALAVTMATMANANVQVAGNFQKLDQTRAAAESGLEVMRYWIDQIAMSGDIAASDRFSTLASDLQTKLTAAGITNLAPTVTASTITFSDVPINATGQDFTAVLTKIGNDNVRLDVTGHSEPISRTIRTNLSFQEQADTVFDYGVASKGPLVLSGSVELEGVNVNVESNAYIESPSNLLALSISGNSHIAGNVKIVNPQANVFLGSHAGVGGARGEEAMQYITIPAPSSGFPDMSPGVFESYATNLLSSSLDLNKAATLTNVRIPAGRNPKFTGNATIQGVLFIEQPNVVEFAGGVDITGVIATNGSQNDDSGTNKLIFSGNVASKSVALLPNEAQFAGLHEKTGTFIMAPGFAASFGGTFTAQTGAIAANGVEFFGNAGGTIRGSVINYADRSMILSGNSSLLFNRSGLVEVPAGFKPRIIMQYDPSSYEEPTP